MKWRGLEGIVPGILRPKLCSLNLPVSSDPASLFHSVCESGQDCVLLESMERDRALSRFSYIGFDPIAEITVAGGCAAVETASGRYETSVDEAFFEMSRRRFTLPGGAFCGGFVGYCSYELAGEFEPALSLSSRASGFAFPLARFKHFSRGVVFDRVRKRTYGINCDEKMLKGFPPVLPGPFEASRPRRRFSSPSFQSKVRTAKEYIASGEAYQIVLSNSTEFSYRGDLRAFYSRLRRINPSTYMYHLRFGDEQIVGSSPEMLVRVGAGRKVRTFPIAGTRRRGKTAKEDAALERELRRDEKERAEHMMLLDLARNDLGRVCKPGSVQVVQSMSVRKYSHVQHLVSEVAGELAATRSSYDVLKSAFPAGTVSGAPKVRAMDIIDRLEGVRRGPYAGCVGYFSPDGSCDFAISIRTLFSERSKAFVQSGAGIVSDSDPSKEFEECNSKAQALLLAAGIGGEKK